MNYYNDREAFERRGIDYDLHGCLENNPQSFSILDIKKVWAVSEGENDGKDWVWIIETHDGQFVYLRGGCDYTGWDCQSDAHSELFPGIVDAVKHTLADWDAEYYAPKEVVFIDLVNQIKNGKDSTWREDMDKIMPNLPKI